MKNSNICVSRQIQEPFKDLIQQQHKWPHQSQRKPSLTNQRRFIPFSYILKFKKNDKKFNERL